LLKIKAIIEQVIEIDIDSLEELDMELPSDMDEVDEFLEEACYVTTSLLSSELLDKDVLKYRFIEREYLLGLLEWKLADHEGLKEWNEQRICLNLINKINAIY
jgi:hypothetical protein